MEKGNSKKRARLWIVGENTVFNYLLRQSLLAELPEFEIVMIGHAIREACEAVENGEAAIILLERLPYGAVGDIVDELREHRPNCRILLFDEYPRPIGACCVVEKMLHAYCTNRDSFEELLWGLRLVAQGSCYFSSRSAHLFRFKDNRLQLRDDGISFALRTLTKREYKCLLYLIRFRDLKSCAEILGLRVRSVENIKRRIMKKLGVRSWVDLIYFGLTQALVD